MLEVPADGNDEEDQCPVQSVGASRLRAAVGRAELPWPGREAPRDVFRDTRLKWDLGGTRRAARQVRRAAAAGVEARLQQLRHLVDGDASASRPGGSSRPNTGQSGPSSSPRRQPAPAPATSGAGGSSWATARERQLLAGGPPLAPCGPGPARSGGPLAGRGQRRRARPAAWRVRGGRLGLWPERLAGRAGQGRQGSGDCESASPGGDGERDRQRGSQASSQRAAAAGALRPSTRSSRTSAGTDGGTEAEPSASWRLRSKFDGLVRKSSRDLRASVPEPERCSLASWVNSSYFTVTIACVVIASTLTIGIEAQLLSSLSREGSSSEKVLIAMATTNYVITFLFMLEMAARIYVYRLDFFVHERMWNCFDFLG
ncbi:unnamed protein product [Prorocentrum cordatum]|uniref:Ion transport domain-containing protein n=1 Tax=Prorocentrum cordatum TaxID=2364126 RepID=A0ABN9UN36_9DINO|nr:unnamed protein product [Polarella glacialis]